ncbi:TRAP transporter small permease [Pseudodesulfovibrio portus]|jgi:TRAP-type C4-dicarboxylate transport system permease small subunit|uniref:2,3-diketo-L-gulonate TRAP transporter permease n=1 Tax=Pseudodesulfovibrio portus TaxID=231439 RepID=A0ABN6RVA2_9BACT|nr:TRAP transporter small permease [Pseudodesulfovibrio portus]BDQ35019.1 2,3-diketo-L-gulonate TRAP transporter permease [Pseudodesulfovibrio portus]
MHYWLDTIEYWLRKGLEVTVTVFFLFILCLTVTLVVLRYGFNSSLIWGSEAMNFLFIYTTALGAAAAISNGTHIKISCLKDMTKGNFRKVMDFVGCLLVCMVNAVMGWFSLPWIASAGAFESPVMRLPMWIVQAIIPLGCGLACFFCLLHMIRIVVSDDLQGSDTTC